MNGIIRRTDLRLRSIYPELETSIYKIEDDKYSIYVSNSDNFEALEKEFRESIKQITVPVTLTEIKPENFVEVIPQIEDVDIPKDFEGIMMTKGELFNFLASKFPGIFFTEIVLHSSEIHVHVASFKEQRADRTHHIFLNNQDRLKLEKFLSGLDIGVVFKVVEDQYESKPNSAAHFIENPVMNIHASGNKTDLEFFKRDEALWFDNVEGIFKGEFKKDDLFFFDSSEYSCYVDYSSFPNVDIRNHLFLFEVIYITIPYEKDISNWLNESKIKKVEFLELIARKRIKIVLNQPEFRYDQNFLQEVYSIAPNSIISRRALACLQQIDIVEMSNNYLLNDPELVQEMKAFCEISSKVLKINARLLYETLVWPIKARRNSFEILNRSGSFGMGAFGVNKAIEERLSDQHKRDLTFDFTVNSPSIHTASALNATYFPFQTVEGYSDLSYASAMGEMLNFYKNASVDKMAAFTNERNKLNSGILPIQPIDVIEVNDFVSILDLESVLSKDVIVPNSKRLIESLAELNENDRKEKIRLYNMEVTTRLNKSNKRHRAIDLGTNVGLDTAGILTGYPFLGSTFTILKNKISSKENRLFRKLNSRIEQAMETDIDSANIHYLCKINRVAKIRRFNDK